MKVEVALSSLWTNAAFQPNTDPSALWQHLKGPKLDFLS